MYFLSAKLTQVEAEIKNICPINYGVCLKLVLNIIICRYSFKLHNNHQKLT